jgi:TatD DNase family protein
VITFKKSDDLRAVAAAVPLDRLLVETDAPYLAPEPFRGRKPNEPSLVVHTATALAKVKGVTQAEMARITTGNFRRLYGKVPADVAGTAA